MKRMMIAIAALGLSVATVGSSQAQDSSAPPAAGNVREACAADIAKVCAGVDRAGIRQCVTDNFSQLSDGCKSAIMAMRAARQSQGGGDGSPSSATH